MLSVVQVSAMHLWAVDNYVVVFSNGLLNSIDYGTITISINEFLSIERSAAANTLWGGVRVY